MHLTVALFSFLPSTLVDLFPCKSDVFSYTSSRGSVEGVRDMAGAIVAKGRVSFLR